MYCIICIHNPRDPLQWGNHSYIVEGKKDTLVATMSTEYNYSPGLRLLFIQLSHLIQTPAGSEWQIGAQSHNSAHRPVSADIMKAFNYATDYTGSQSHPT